MKKYITILLLAFSGSAIADSYLCIAEAGGGIRKHWQSKKVEGLIYNVKSKWLVTSKVVTDSETKWSVGVFGSPGLYFMDCKEEMYSKDIVCSLGLGGLLEKFRLYHIDTLGWDVGEYIALTQADGTEFSEIIVQTGRCSKI